MSSIVCQHLSKETRLCILISLTTDHVICFIKQCLGVGGVPVLLGAANSVSAMSVSPNKVVSQTKIVSPSSASSTKIVSPKLGPSAVSIVFNPPAPSVSLRNVANKQNLSVKQKNELHTAYIDMVAEELQNSGNELLFHST